MQGAKIKSAGINRQRQICQYKQVKNPLMYGNKAFVLPASGSQMDSHRVTPRFCFLVEEKETRPAFGQVCRALGQNSTHVPCAGGRPDLEYIAAT